MIKMCQTPYFLLLKSIFISSYSNVETFQRIEQSEQSKLEESPIKRRISLKNDKRKRDRKKEENRHGGNKSTLYLFPVSETGMRGSLSLLIVSSMPRFALL